MAEEEGRGKNKEMLNVQQYRGAVSAMDNGNVKAKTKVAFYKLSGLGCVEVDEEGAVVLLEERAKDGDSEAMWMLGLCCEYGKGTEQDYKTAKMLYMQSCTAGNAVGNFLLGNNAEGGRMRVKGLSDEPNGI